MSYREEEDLRPPHTPKRWEALTDEKDWVEAYTENEDSGFEGAEKIRFCKLIPKKQVARWTKTGKSEANVQAFMIQPANEQVKS